MGRGESKRVQRAQRKTALQVLINLVRTRKLHQDFREEELTTIDPKTFPRSRRHELVVSFLDEGVIKRVDGGKLRLLKGTIDGLPIGLRTLVGLQRLHETLMDGLNRNRQPPFTKRDISDAICHGGILGRTAPDRIDADDLALILDALVAKGVFVRQDGEYYRAGEKFRQLAKSTSPVPVETPTSHDLSPAPHTAGSEPDSKPEPLQKPSEPEPEPPKSDKPEESIELEPPRPEETPPVPTDVPQTDNFETREDTPPPPPPQPMPPQPDLMLRLKLDAKGNLRPTTRTPSSVDGIARETLVRLRPVYERWGLEEFGLWKFKAKFKDFKKGTVGKLFQRLVVAGVLIKCHGRGMYRINPAKIPQEWADIQPPAPKPEPPEDVVSEPPTQPAPPDVPQTDNFETRENTPPPKPMPPQPDMTSQLKPDVKGNLRPATKTLSSVGGVTKETLIRLRPIYEQWGLGEFKLWQAAATVNNIRSAALGMLFRRLADLEILIRLSRGVFRINPDKIPQEWVDQVDQPTSVSKPTAESSEPDLMDRLQRAEHDRELLIRFIANLILQDHRLANLPNELQHAVVGELLARLTSQRSEK